MEEAAIEVLGVGVGIGIGFYGLDPDIDSDPDVDGCWFRLFSEQIATAVADPGMSTALRSVGPTYR